MKSQIANVFDRMTDLLFLESDKEGGRPPNLDMSALTMSSDESQDGRGSYYSTSGGGDSRMYLPSPPRVTSSQVGSTASSAFSPIHRPAPNANSSFSYDYDISFDALSNGESSGTETSVSRESMVEPSMIESAIESIRESEDASVGLAHTETMVRSTPMARMRLDPVALATQMIAEKPVSPPRKPQMDPEKTMADKHRKWRRQIKEAQRRKDQEKRQKQAHRGTTHMCLSTANLLLGSEEKPSRLFEKLTAMGCGEIDDAFSDATFSDASSVSVLKALTRPRAMIHRIPLASPSENGLNRGALDVEEDIKEPVESEMNKSLDSAKSALSELDMHDRNFIQAFIRETSQEGYPLIWHKPSEDGRTFDNPIEIVAFLERGFLQEEGNFAGPRLAWYSTSGAALGAIDLLDIRSLVKASPLQLSEFPFAMPGNSLILKLHNSFDELVLEADSTLDARRFIHGLRWVVARLAFNLIIGNREVSCELLELRDGPQINSKTEMKKAMNDVTIQLIEKTSFANRQKLV